MGTTFWWVGEDNEGNRGILETKVVILYEKEIVGKRGWWIFKRPVRVVSTVNLKRYVVRFNDNEALLLMCENMNTQRLSPLLEQQDYQEILSEAMDQNKELIEFYKKSTKTLIAKNTMNYKSIIDWVKDVQNKMGDLVRLAVDATQQRYDLFLEHLNVNIKESDISKFKQKVAQQVAEDLQLDVGSLQYQTFNPPVRREVGVGEPRGRDVPVLGGGGSEVPRLGGGMGGGGESMVPSATRRQSESSSDSALSTETAEKADLDDKDDLMDLMKALETGDVVIEDAGSSGKK